MDARAASRGRLQLVLPVLVIFALIARLVVIVLLAFHLSGDRLPQSYTTRFAQIATEQGRPYRDFPVEYPPVSLLAIELVGDPSERATGVRLLWLSVAADAVVTLSLLAGWRRRAAVTYLAVSVPLLPFLYQSIDLVSAALAVAALALVVRARERGGGLLLAAAVLAKVWPFALLPALMLLGRRRALAWAVGGLVVGSALWIGLAGVAGPRQVLTQRGSPGWEVESTVGTIVWTIGGDQVRMVKDSPRVGTAPLWSRALLGIAALAGIALVWARAARRGSPVEVGAASLAAVSVLLFFAPIYSYPYVAWLLPWGAIAATERRHDLVALVAAISVLTALALNLSGYGVTAAAPLVVQLGFLVRNALTGAIPAVWLWSTRRRAPMAAGLSLPVPDSPTPAASRP